MLLCAALSSCAVSNTDRMAPPVSEKTVSAPEREKDAGTDAEEKRKGDVSVVEAAAGVERSRAGGDALFSGHRLSDESERRSSALPKRKAFVTETANQQRLNYVLAEDIPEKLSGNADEGIVFNFDDADLYEVVRTLADLLKINYIVESGVRGKVTIHTAGSLRRSDLFDIFYQVLEANGLTAIKEGNLYKIGPLKNAPRSPIAARFGRKAGSAAKGERVVMQIVPLEYMAAAEMTKLLTPFISAEGTIIAHGESNTLLIVDRDVNIVKALELISVFDIDMFQDVRHRFYSLDYLEAEEMAKLLADVLGAYQPEGKPDFKIIPIKRLNMLLMVGKDGSMFAKAEAFIRQLDIPVTDVTPRIYVYYVKNGEAEDLSGLLNEVFGLSRDVGQTAGEIQTAKEVKNPYAPPNPFEPLPKETPRSKTSGQAALPGGKPASSEEGSGTLRKSVKITPDVNRNALIIESIPSDYRIMEDILKKLDVLPRQVLIEVVIAEISLDGGEDLGVEWDYKKGDGGSLGLSLLSAQMGSAGLQYIIGETERWSAAFSALATQNRVNILSAPVVLASDNKEAKINVSDKIPVASAEYIYNTGGEGVTQTNIQYRDTGIILSVKPHINERGLVSMEVSQEVSEQGDGVDVGGQSYPSFRERSVDTVCTVKNGQTVIMGGLMRERESKGRSGVPILSQIPGLGFLFGKDSEEYVKTELILLITPRVIVSLEDIDAVTEEFKSKVDGVRRQQQSAESSLFNQLPASAGSRP